VYNIWNNVLASIESSVSKDKYTLFFKDTTLISDTDNHIIIGVKNAFIEKQLSSKYRGIIETALKNNEINPSDITFQVVRENKNKVRAREVTASVPTPIKKVAKSHFSSTNSSSLKSEYTLPDVSQTVIITRAAGKTDVPDSENLKALASHGATMVLFLSTGLLEKVSADLIAGGYNEKTPAAIIYKASWKDEKVCRCTVGTLKQTAEANGITKTALIAVGDFLKSSFSRSKLYDPGFSTEFREASK
jgi:precorrin-4 methylase